MIKRTIQFISVAIIIGSILPSAMAQNYKTAPYYSQLDNSNAKIIKINALEREYYGHHMKTLGHRYKPTYHYNDYRQVSKPRYFVMVPSRSNFTSARNYWP